MKTKNIHRGDAKEQRRNNIEPKTFTAETLRSREEII